MTLELEKALQATADQITAHPLNWQHVQAAVQRRKHRRTALTATAGLAVLAVPGLALTHPWSLQTHTSNSVATAPTIPGVQRFTELSRNHVQGPVNYPQDPPVGGNHNTEPQTCNIYTHPIPNTSAVHSLEHGAVWITYGPNVPPDQVKTLENDAAPADKVLVSPYPSLENNISLQAWGLQLVVTDANDPRINEFVKAYVDGPQTPEPGAVCVGSDKTVDDPHDPTPQS